MRKTEIWAPALILLLFVSTTMAGCLGTEGDSKEEEGPLIETDTFELQGQVETLAQASPNTVSEEIHFEIPGSQFTRMRINITIEDGDDNTDIDHIDNIRMWRETGEEPTGIEQATGGDTPYSTSIEFEYKGDERGINWWIVEITAKCAAGEDTWIGPLIWQGVPDHGVFYTIEADYDCLVELIEEDEETW